MYKEIPLPRGGTRKGRNQEPNRVIVHAMGEYIKDDDGQIYHHEVTLHNMNTSFTIRGVPLNEEVAECLSREAFTIVRLRVMDNEQ